MRPAAVKTGGGFSLSIGLDPTGNRPASVGCGLREVRAEVRILD